MIRLVLYGQSTDTYQCTHHYKPPAIRSPITSRQQILLLRCKSYPLKYESLLYIFKMYKKLDCVDVPKASTNEDLFLIDSPY